MAAAGGHSYAYDYASNTAPKLDRSINDVVCAQWISEVGRVWERYGCPFQDGANLRIPSHQLVQLNGVLSLLVLSLRVLEEVCSCSRFRVGEVLPVRERLTFNLRLCPLPHAMCRKLTKLTRERVNSCGLSGLRPGTVPTSISVPIITPDRHTHNTRTCARGESTDPG